MDYKQLRKQLADISGRTADDVDSLVEGLGAILRDCASDLDTVAVPTFGSFVPVKHKEEVVDDLSTGKRMLLPPEIKLEFHPGGLLQKRLRNE